MNYLFIQANEVKDIVGIENVTIYGVLFLIIIGLVYDKIRTEKRHDLEKSELRKAIKSAQDRLDQEYKDSTGEIRKLAENYHVFTTQVFERLNTVINNLR